MANYNRLFFNLFLFVLIPIVLSAQSKSDQTVVGTVGGQDVTYAELKENYSGGSGDEITLEGLESFLPIYLDYKAKLLAAKDQGYYQDSALVEEHKNYVKQAAYAFWLEKEIKPAAFEDYRQRAEVELKPYHILVALASDASQNEINAAIAKLNQAKAEIQNGVPLDEVNEKYSTKRGGRSMGGDIPWISAGRTVQEFEDQVYGLEVGEISEPFRTQFGYHIVVLQDKRERTPARLVSHIYVRGTGDSTAYDKIHKAYNRLEQGRSWNLTLNEFTEDGASKRSNGRIGWVSFQENFQMDFVEAVMNVDPEKDYSKPVKTIYGFHIFKIDSVETYASEQERRQVLMEQLEKTPYYEKSNQFVINYLKDKFGEGSSPEQLQKYKTWLTQFDSTAISELEVPVAISGNKVYEFDSEAYTVGDFHRYAQRNYADRVGGEYRDSWFNNYKNYVVDATLIELTLEKYPSFQKQSQSYLDGLVVYNINEDNVWSSETVDSTRLRSMYENNIQKYQYPARPFYYLLTALHDSTLQKAVTFIENGGSPDSLKLHVKQLGVSFDSTTSFTQEPFDKLQEMEVQSFSESFEYNNIRGMFWLEDRLPARTMTFDEAFGRLVSEIQPQREKEWLEELRTTYKVKANFGKLRKAYQKDS